jgi:protoporphyrinogen oxidase
MTRRRVRQISLFFSYVARKNPADRPEFIRASFIQFYVYICVISSLMVVILGAGLAGLSSSYHLKHKCLIFEKQDHSGGHIYSHKVNGFTWDEGPHVSFTKHAYVKELFAESPSDGFLEYPVYPTNYYKGNWVPHPAQTNLYALPEPIRSECLESFLSSRERINQANKPENYKEWLHMAFGDRFADEFPGIYTLKYWTTPPENLTVDWVGERVYYPEIEDVKSGYLKAPEKSKNYLTSVRYPKTGGYFAYADKLKKGAPIQYNKEVIKVDLENKIIRFNDGTEQKYDKLINTFALPEFIKKTNAPADVKKAADDLSCSEVLLINVVVNHPAPVINQWLYVYDKDKYSTRVSYTDLFAPNNGVKGKSGIQAEVYFSKYRKQTESLSFIIDSVCKELVEMGLVKDLEYIEEVNTKKIQFANVIFDHPRRKSLDKIYNYLSQFGLMREEDDLEPMTDWNKKFENNEMLGDLIMAGRFGQWKYYWTDDCVMRGLYISKKIKKE